MSQDRKYNSYKDSYSRAHSGAHSSYSSHPGSRSAHTGSNGRSRKRRRRSNTPLIIGVGVVVLLLIIALVFVFKGKGGKDEIDAAEETTTLADNGEIKHNAVVDLTSVFSTDSGIADDLRINVKGMTPEGISEAIASKYSWSLSISNPDANVGDTIKPKADIDQTTAEATLGDPENPDSAGEDATETQRADITVSDSIKVPDYIAERIPAFIEQISEADRAMTASADSTQDGEAAASAKSDSGKSDASGDASSEDGSDGSTSGEPETVYTFTLDDIDDEIASIAKYAAEMWYVEPLGGSIGFYDSQSDSFIMENSRNGYKVDKDTLAANIKSAIGRKDYSAAVAVTGTKLSAEDSENVSGSYKTIATYTTNTTSNAVRNKNIQLACEKLNGTIVRPGEEFSFNGTVGQRTKEAGYGEAAAYNNGEVVQEVGGGVCQVSTTLYNAVLKAGLKITARQSHTFKPTYVTPGQDATISWGGPDFKFANLPNKPEYSYNTNYAIGIRASYSNQTVTVSIYGRPVLKDGYTFSLDSTQTKTIEMVRKPIEPGSDKTPTKGSEGSQWETRLVIKKDGELVSNNVDHNALYAGHIEYYYEESETSETETSESETSESESEVISDNPEGPGGNGSSPGVIGPYEDTDNDEPLETTTQAVVSTDAPSAETTAPQSSESGTTADAPGSTSSGSSSGGGVISSDGPGSLDFSGSGGPGA